MAFAINPFIGMKKICIYYTNNVDSIYAAGWVYRFAKQMGEYEIELSNAHLENYEIPKNPVDDTVAVICGAIPHMRMFDEAMKMYYGNVIVFENTPTFLKYLRMYNWKPRGLMFENVSISKLTYLFLYMEYRMGKDSPWNTILVPNQAMGSVLVDCRNYVNYKSAVLNVIGSDYPFMQILDLYHNDVFLTTTDKSLMYYLEHDISPFNIPGEEKPDTGYIIKEDVRSMDVIEKACVLYTDHVKFYDFIVRNGGLWPAKIRKFNQYDAISVNNIYHDPEIFRHRLIFDLYHIGIIFHMEHDKMYYSLYRLGKDPDDFIDIEKICKSFGGRGTAKHGSFTLDGAALEISAQSLHP